MKHRLILEFNSKQAKEEFIGQFLDGWGEGLGEWVQPIFQRRGWVVDDVMQLEIIDNSGKRL